MRLHCLPRLALHVSLKAVARLRPRARLRAPFPRRAQDSYWPVRCDAAEALGSMGAAAGAEGAQVLIKTLAQDSHRLVRFAAADSEEESSEEVVSPHAHICGFELNWTDAEKITQRRQRRLA